MKIEAFHAVIGRVESTKLHQSFLIDCFSCCTTKSSHFCYCLNRRHNSIGRLFKGKFMHTSRMRSRRGTLTEFISAVYFTFFRNNRAILTIPHNHMISTGLLRIFLRMVSSSFNFTLLKVELHFMHQVGFYAQRPKGFLELY